MRRSAGIVCIGALHSFRYWVVRATTCAVGESPTQLWMEIEVIFRREDGEESKGVVKFIIILFHILLACNLLSKVEDSSFIGLEWWHGTHNCCKTVAHISYNSTNCCTAAARQQIKCRAYLNIVRRGIATAIKINKGITEFASSKNMRHRWKKHDSYVNFLTKHPILLARFANNCLARLRFWRYSTYRNPFTPGTTRCNISCHHGLPVCSHNWQNEYKITFSTDPNLLSPSFR